MNTLQLLLSVLVVGTALITANPAEEYKELLERDLERELLKRLLNIEKKAADDKDYILVCTQNPIELGIVLDTSSSIRPNDFAKGIEFLQHFLQQFDIGDGPNQVRVSLIPFAKGVYPNNAFNLNEHPSKKETIAAVGNIKHEKGRYTATGEGISYMLEHQLTKKLSRGNAERISIVITDGNSQEKDKTAAAAQAARDDGVLMIVIGVGHRVRDSELLSIAGDKERVYKVNKYEDLEDIKEELARQTCVKTKKPKTHCGEVNPADVYFGFSPIELGRNVGLARSLVTYTAKHEELSKGFRFGVVSGSCPDDKGFDLDDYQDAAGITERMKAYEGGHMSKLITRLATSGYKKASGGRDNARDIAVLIAGPGKEDTLTLKDDVAKLVKMGVEVYIYYTAGNLEIAGTTTLKGRTSNEIGLDLISHMCPESKLN